MAVDEAPSPERTWHHLPAEQVVAALESDPTAGLSSHEVSRRLERFGPNRLPEGTRRSLAAVLLSQFKSPLIYLLFIAAAIAFALGEGRDAIVILVVVLAMFGVVTGIGILRGLELPVLPLVGAQCFGAAVGNIICPHNIIAGGATVGLSGMEGEVLKRTLWVGLFYAALGGLLAFLFV